MVQYSKLLLAAFVNTAVALLVIRIVRASEPVEWTAKPGDGPKSFVRHHGSTLEFRCAFAGFGGAFAESSDVRLWYQTNGMGRAWWSVPATRSNDVLSASWPPSADPGADRVSFFFGAPSNAYASAVVRLQHSPGFTPNVVSAPVQTIDFSKVDVANAPWIRPDDSALEAMRESIGQKQNALTVDQLSTLNGGPYVSATSGYDNTEIPYNPIAFLGLFRGATLHGGRGGRSIYLAYKPSVSGYNSPLFGLGIMTLEDSLIQGSVITNFSAFASSVDVATHIADAENPHNVTAEQIGAFSAEAGDELAGVVNAWETYWDGDDVRVTVTNYDSHVNIPSLYLEQNTNSVVGGTPAYRVVWDERTRWDQFLDGYNAFATNVVENYADRAWGVYDSASGNYSPDGLLQISQGQIMIANGLAYQKTVTTGGCAVWVLQATDPTMVSGVMSNGYFRIADGDGNALFEIVKGDKRTVGATASSIVANNGMTITYNVTAADHPKLEIATDLNGTWLSEGNYSGVANVSWTGSSGAWVATVTPIGNRPIMFAKASYETGGETYVKHSAPLGFSRIYVNGTNYNVHVETMNGKKVLVLQ